LEAAARSKGGGWEKMLDARMIKKLNTSYFTLSLLQYRLKNVCSYGAAKGILEFIDMPFGKSR
jgi:hypothetical protein